MSLNERQVSIVDLLEDHEYLSVDYLAKTLFASASTIRRDLTVLERGSYLRRTRGGAVRIQPLADLPFDLRIQNSPDVKSAIAKRAAAFIQDGDCIFLDSSSTVSRMVPHLVGLQDLTIVTNGILAAAELEQLHKFRIFSTGGLLLWKARSYVGAPAREMVRQFRFNKVFFSAGGISPVHGVYDANIEHVELLRQVLQCAQNRILLADAHKFTKLPSCRLCGLEDVDILVTDAEPPVGTPDTSKFVQVHFGHNQSNMD